jgi:hypothetical protein
MLQLLGAEREVILEKVRRAPLPALRHIRGCILVDLNTLSGFRLSVLRPSNWHLFQIRGYLKE